MTSCTLVCELFDDLPAAMPGIIPEFRKLHFGILVVEGAHPCAKSNPNDLLCGILRENRIVGTLLRIGLTLSFLATSTFAVVEFLVIANSFQVVIGPVSKLDSSADAALRFVDFPYRGNPYRASIRICPSVYQPSGSRPAIPNRTTGLPLRGSSMATRKS